MPHVFNGSVILFSLLSLLTAGEAQDKGPLSLKSYQKNCLPGFAADRKPWQICEKKPCVLLLKEAPFVSVGKNLSSKPFPCNFRSRRAQRAAGFGGLFFQIMDMIPELDDAQCVFGGLDCSVQDMVHFLEADDRHQFMFGGSVWILPDRISNNTNVSPALHEERILVVGHKTRQSDVEQSFDNVVRPFDKWTWALIVGFYVGVCVVHVSLSCYYAKPRDFANVCRHILCDYTKSTNPETVRFTNTSSVGVLRFVVAFTSILIVLFYEITVVNYVFRNQPRTLEKDIRDLSPEELKTYVLVQGGGSELLFRSLVDPDGLFETKTPPWRYCTSVDNCYDQLLGQLHGTQFFFTFEHGFRDKLRSRQTCDRLTVFETVSPLSSVSAGWYYGSRFPRNKRIAIDRDILGERLKNRIQDLLKRENPEPRCRASGTSIPPTTIGWPLLAISTVGTLILIILVVFTCWQRRSRRPVRRFGRKDYLGAR